MTPESMHVKQIAAKDTTIAEKDAAITKQKDALTIQDLTIKRLNADIEALKAAHEEEIETLRQRWEKEANECKYCKKEGRDKCQKAGWIGCESAKAVVKLER